MFAVVLQLPLLFADARGSDEFAGSYASGPGFPRLGASATVALVCVFSCLFRRLVFVSRSAFDAQLSKHRVADISREQPFGSDPFACGSSRDACLGVSVRAWCVSVALLAAGLALALLAAPAAEQPDVCGDACR